MFIFSNLATSLDGKIATSSREFFPLGTTKDRKQMQTLRKKCDAVLMGASTLRTFQKPLVVFGQEKQPINVIVSSKLEGISPKWEFFTDPRIERLLILSDEVSDRTIAKFAKNSHFLVLKKLNAPNIVAVLEALGIKRLLVEGGGGTNWDFAKHNLIDEWNVTITPRILGGTEAPTLVDGPGFVPKDVVNLRLKSCKKVGDELYLVYKKSERRGP